MATTKTWPDAAAYMKDFRTTFDKGWSDAISHKADPPAEPALYAAYDAGFKATAGTSDQLMRTEYQTAAQSLAMRGFQVGFDPNAPGGLDPQLDAILGGFPDKTQLQSANLGAVYSAAKDSGRDSRMAPPAAAPPPPKSNLVNNLVAGGIFVAGVAAAGFILRLVLKKRPDEATLQSAA